MFASVWFGINPTSGKILIFIGALWPVVVATTDGVARVPMSEIETARMLGTDVPAGSIGVGSDIVTRLVDTIGLPLGTPVDVVD